MRRASARCPAPNTLSPIPPGLLSSGRLAPSHVERFVAVLLRGHPGAGQGQGQGAAAGLPSRPLPRGRLDALAADFFAMARGEAAEDVLLAYEIY